jgi:hypothetical protein
VPRAFLTGAVEGIGGTATWEIVTERGEGSTRTLDVPDHSTAMHRAARRGQQSYAALRATIRGSPAVSPDETGWRVDAMLAWLWAFVTGDTTVYAILPGRGFEEAASVLGDDYAGGLSCDGWALYRQFDRAVHQTCLAHLLREGGLRTARRISHVFIMDVPTYHKVLIVTDGATNIAPSLEDKVDICQNAIDLAVSLGLDRPKVAILAAVETVTSKMPATSDAAALGKMAERGQIKGGSLDGPLAFDNAISLEAAQTKGIRSDVAGDPDILLAPDLEAGNILAKQLTFLARADSAGLVLGARVPVILTSRADSVRARIASCGVAMLAAHARRQPAAKGR